MIIGDEEGPWIGASGTEYTYYVFRLDIKLPPRAGNYIYAKRNNEHLWVPIYMGHGDLSNLCTDETLLREILFRQATHVHARLNTLEHERVTERIDLLSRYENAFPPDGCNKTSDLSGTKARRDDHQSGA